MASTKAEERELLKKDLSVLIVALKQYSKMSNVECPASFQTDLDGDAKYDEPQMALKLCFKRILHSKKLIVIYPEALPTSVVLEVGLAMAFCKYIIIFVKKGVALPFLLRRVEDVLDKVTIYEYENSITDIEKIIKSKRAKL